jgi:hypothetical protein
MCSSWLPAQQKLKIIWHHALLLAAPMECHVPSFQLLSQNPCTFFKRYAVSSKRPTKKNPFGRKSAAVVSPKEKPNKKNRTESAFFFLLN